MITRILLGWLAFFHTLALAQPFQKTMKRLPDTGQTNSYTNSFGEDHDYTIFPPTFELNGNGTVTDTITGLTWIQGDGGEMTYENALLYADTCTYAGFTDWRLPSSAEAFSILNHQKNNPALDGNYFTPSGAEYWWTSTRQVNDPNKIWCINAGGGIGNHPKSETISAGGTKKFHTRLVRNGMVPFLLPNRWQYNASDETLTDLATGLEWMQNPLTAPLNWESALAAVENLSTPFSDWRLPNIKELRSIHNELRINPCVNILFGISGNEKYWSSTSLPNQPTRAWYFHTQFGITSYDEKTVANRVLAVRGPIYLITASAKIQNSKPLAWPNPFTRRIFLQPEWANQSMVLHDLRGKIVYAGKEIEEQDFLDLPPGPYFLGTPEGGWQKLMHQ